MKPEIHITPKIPTENGYIKKGDDGKYTQKRRPAKESSQRFIVIPASAFTDKNE